ncbi:GMC oxidoreductase [Lophiostoma macrostomum CBS 122681]|uniref:GMC oxidoreductase n=1 Tax=Lophiostoma macrostomum CBS 122681 TaxID=1314788 RepID=A0A6A6TJE6_9PLEO|nr:GMC oxidoreductase [Lophiostoma macrostomum CBS 122681]
MGFSRAFRALYLLLTLSLTPSPLALASSPSNSISGQQLLGSSFGIPSPATYDYIIVGGGTAGLVLANRLSASGSHSIAVIEAGSFYELSNGNQSQIPRYAWNSAGPTFSDVNPLVDWNFTTQPEQGIGGRRLHYPRGKTLGGSSARNLMAYQRATSGAYKRWAEAVGDERYLWENWRKYFDRSTTFHRPDMSKRLANSTPYVDPAGARAKDGPVSIAYVNWVMPLTTWVMRAVQAMGMKPIPGYIDGELIGSSWYLRTTGAETQVRESSETAYLRPVLGRKNLIVYHSTMAMKVIVEGKEAVGVECNTLGKEFLLSANKEVIVSAGAIGSPHLLMVSGIGPKKTLDKFGIPIIMDAVGVGQALEDQPAVALTYKVRVPSSTVLDSPAKVQAAVSDFLSNGTGPLASTGGDIVAWEKVPRRLVSNDTAKALSAAPDDWPDLEFIVQASYPGQPPDSDDYAELSVVLVNPFSRGNVTISSPNVLDQPLITVNFLTDPRDKEVAIAAFRRGQEILGSPSMAAVVVGPAVPGNGTITDTQILEYIQQSARTISHVSCTCKMGKAEDGTAVVDSTGRVFGVERLRVVDASAMPFLPPGHPSATVYALGELISDIIMQGNNATE